MTCRRPTILVELGCFQPGLRANGPNRSFERIVSALSDRFRFRVISTAAPGEPLGAWHELNGCERIALAPGRPFTRGLRNLLQATPHDLLVCNGFFDPTLTLPTLLMRRAGLIDSPLLLAPRGEFNAGALTFRSIRKRAYLRFLKTSGLLDAVTLQGTDAREAARIATFLPHTPILIGPNVRLLDPLPAHAARKLGEPLRVVFLSRIDRMKNLDVALRIIAAADVPLIFDIYGPTGDAAYWDECRALIAAMPPEVVTTYRGSVVPEDVATTLARYDLFLLPTRGENFGHAIADALLAGTPALIADTTPWRGLADACAGADLPLDDLAPWRRYLNAFSSQSPDESRRWRDGARRFAEQKLDSGADIEQLSATFMTAIGAGAVHGIRSRDSSHVRD